MEIKFNPLLSLIILIVAGIILQVQSCKQKEAEERLFNILKEQNENIIKKFDDLSVSRRDTIKIIEKNINHYKTEKYYEYVKIDSIDAIMDLIFEYWNTRPKLPVWQFKPDTLSPPIRF